MTKRTRKEKKTAPTPRRRVSFRRRQQSASIFFLLWTVISAIAVAVVLLFGLTQRAMLVRSYKDEASKEIAVKGVEIKQAIEQGPPDNFGNNNYNGYLHFLSRTYNVNVYVLDERGALVHPQDFGLSETDYQKEIDTIRAQLAKQAGNSAVYEGDGEYVYGAKINLHGATSYLHVGKSLQLMETSLSRMGTRTALLSVFVVLVTFAVSSGVAGWLVNPLSELSQKARKLAEGDFDVDFYGNDYGRELVELAESLNFARDELAKTDRMQKELIANVSHDFKTPLTMIKGYASMIKEISGGNPEKRDKHAQIIIDEADRLASLVADVLDLSKIRSGIARLELREMDMTAYLDEVLSRFAYLRDSQGYEFILDADEGLVTRADELKIGQVLYNLIGNAVNYTGEDKRVYVSLKKENGSFFRFAVTDTGKGIKPEEIKDIWDRYYRSSEAHKRPVQGTGLGLSIVKTILEKHGFPFGVTSEVGKGSTFYVLFPSL